jgi:hypothetical protein
MFWLFDYGRPCRAAESAGETGDFLTCTGTSGANEHYSLADRLVHRAVCLTVKPSLGLALVTLLIVFALCNWNSVL